MVIINEFTKTAHAHVLPDLKCLYHHHHGCVHSIHIYAYMHTFLYMYAMKG